MGHSIQDDHLDAPATGTTTPPLTSPHAARASASLVRRPRWHLIFFLLAGFDLLTVLLGLHLSHRITGIYTESISVNQQWAERLGRYDELRRLAAAVNAPGNNVFDSRDVATESGATRDARRAFDAQFSQAQQDLAQRTAPTVAAILQDDLAAVQDAMNAMTAEARLIFSYFENDEAARAGERMATMDRKYDLVNVAFGRLNQHVRDIQASYFRTQIDAAHAVQRFEWLIGVFILLMVAGATAYGRHLSRRAETDQQATEARFANILDIAADAIVAMDEDQRIVLFNQSAEQIFGYRAEEVLGKPLGLLLPPGAAGTHHERVRAFAQGTDHARRMSEHGEVSGRRKDGTEFPAEASISKVTQNGRTIFTAILRDITEHKRAEKALQKNERRLADSQRIAHLGSWELDLGHNVLWWSDEVYRIFEMDPRTFGASYETFLDTVHPDDREFVNRAYTESVQTRTPYDIVHRLLMKDGRVKYVNECCETEYGMDGKPMRSIGTVRDVTERMQTEKTIQSLAYYDPLTTLPNRALLHDRLTQAIQAGRHQHKPLAFLLLDLDRFKDINNTLGHHHGDLILQQMGPRLQGLLRQVDMIARLGGDEFAILLPGTDAEGAVRVVNKLHQALVDPFLIDGLTITVEASIGIALYPDHGETADLLIQRANVAMYHAKQAGGGHTVYSTEHDHYNPRRLALMTELRYAIEHDELVLYYQPKIHLKTGRVIGVEALVRWRHPNRGLIAPDEFIPLAERTGLIKPLTLWVLTAALHQSRTWQRAGLRLSVAVNLSARNLQDTELADQIEEMLTRSGIPPNQLELEITESTIMADPPRALEILTRLHHMQIPLAIDDFGTGYSSLGYLRKLPVSSIKIDKSFVKNMAADDSDAVIVRSTIELAHNLGLLVVAEGVETQYVWDRLAALGCDAAQGYYMSAPMPAAALTRWFHESSWQVTKIADEAHPEAA